MKTRSLKLIVCAALTFLLACGDSDTTKSGSGEGSNAANGTANVATNSGTNSSTGNASANSSAGLEESCIEGCVAKASSCGVDENVAMQGCAAEICAGTLSQDYIDCLQTLTCDAQGDACEAFKDDGGQGGVDDDLSEGSSCQCDAKPELAAGVKNSCTGTDVGCELSSSSQFLSCLNEARTGEGTCRYICGEADAGTQGSCPSGYRCDRGPEAEPDSGRFFYICR